MMMSPGSIFLPSSITVSPVNAAGTITHTARGLLSLATNSSRVVGAGRALACELLHRVGVDVVDDALVAVAHESADEVRAHPTQSHHAELHLVLLSVLRQLERRRR